MKLLSRIIIRIYRSSMKKLDASRRCMKDKSANRKDCVRLPKNKKLKLKGSVKHILINSQNKLPLKKEKKQRLELRKNGGREKPLTNMMQTYLK